MRQLVYAFFLTRMQSMQVMRANSQHGLGKQQRAQQILEVSEQLLLIYSSVLLLFKFKFDSEDDFCSGCQNESHQQQLFSEVLLPR